MKKLSIKTSKFNYRKDFSFFELNKNIVYLDSASATLRVNSSIKAINKYYNNYPMNPHSDQHFLGKMVKKMESDARENIANFINADKKNLVFTYNATTGLNIASYFCKDILQEGDEVLLSPFSHASNISCWVETAKLKKAKIKYAKLEKGRLTNKSIMNSITKKTKVFAVEHVSNSLTFKVDLETISLKIKEKGIYLIIDSAQSVAHIKTDVKKLNADFLSFSGYKIFGPSGIGVLYINPKIINKFKPLITGGFQFNKITDTNIEYKNDYLRHEPSTPNTAGIIGLSKAISYVKKIGIQNIHNHEKEIIMYTINKLKEINNIKIYSDQDSGSNVIFALDNMDSLEVVKKLSNDNVLLKSGDFAAIHLPKIINVTSSIRASISIYTNKKDIDTMIKSLKKIIPA